MWNISNFDWNEVTAIATAASAIATLVLVLIGVWQITSIRDEARRERTLAVCNRYDSDTVLHECIRKLFDGRRSGDRMKHPQRYTLEAYCVLNYLDSVAIGIEQKVYIEKLARDHLKEILESTVADLLAPKATAAMSIDPLNFQRLVRLAGEWSSDRFEPCTTFLLGSDA